jgi:hypothetical protein
MRILVAFGGLFALLVIVGSFGAGFSAVLGGLGLAALGVAYMRSTRQEDDTGRPWGLVFLLAGVGLVAYGANDVWLGAEDMRERGAVERCHDDPASCLARRQRAHH